MRRDYYRTKADQYDQTWQHYTDSTHRKLLQYVPPSLDKQRILDYGCGTGELIIKLLDLYPEIDSITGYDQVEEMLQQARQKITQLPKQLQQKVLLQSQKEFNGKFDLIISSSVLHYLQQPIKTLRDLQSLLKKGGMIVLVDYTKKGFLARYFEWFFKRIDSSHQKAYYPEQIRKMLQHSAFEPQEWEEFRISLLWKGYVIKAIAPHKST